MPPPTSCSAPPLLLAVVVLESGFVSADGCDYWTQTSAPSKNWISVASSSDGSKLVAAVIHGPIYTSSDSGGSWTQVSTAHRAQMVRDGDGRRQLE